MPIKPELNVSGYRGIWGEDLNDELISLYAKAFVSFTKEDNKKENITILIGRDGRESGPLIKNVIINELNNLKVNFVYGDIMPTPTVLFSVRKHKYDGAIIITASHNPIQYNGLKFVNSKAFFTIKEEVEKIKKYYEIYSGQPFIKNENKNLEIKNIAPDFSKEHADFILENINVEKIKEKKFKIAVDMINASSAVIDPYFFEKLNVEFIPLNGEPNGKFAHRPEPLKENLLDIAKMVKDHKADLGFAHDPDADRLIIIDENGEMISEEYTIVFAIENILSKNKGRNVVINLSTSNMGEDLVNKYGSKCYRSKIGEGYVVEKMIDEEAIIGGEGNGGVIYPKINFVRDSFVGIGLVLELLAENNKKVSEYVKEFPKYFMKKDKWPIKGNLKDVYNNLKNYFKDEEFNEEDGLKIIFKDRSWLHLRPSNTEPIIKLFGESKSQERIDFLFEEVKKFI